MKRLRGAVITDANILIDYCDSNITILQYFSEMLNGEVYIASPVLEEVDQLSKEDALALGFKVFDPTLELLWRAAVPQQGISFQDNICLLSAAENGWICATNDKKLRRECKSHHVDTIWGLQIMLFLLEDGRLNKKTAMRTARKISENNREITSELLGDFEKKIDLMEK